MKTQDTLKDFDPQSCEVGDFVFRSALPELGLTVRVLKSSPFPSFMEPREFHPEELPYMEFEASLSRQGSTLIRTWQRVY